jgi:hypothetical protein
MAVAATKALKRCGMPPNASRFDVIRKFNDMLADAAADRTLRANTLLDSFNDLNAILEIDEYMELFQCRPTSSAGTVDPYSSAWTSPWAGCWCKGVVVFVLQSRYQTRHPPQLYPNEFAHSFPKCTALGVGGPHRCST